VADLKLTATPALGGFSHVTDDITVREITGRSIISIAQNKSGLTALSKAIKASLGIALPAPGKTATAPERNTTLMSVALDQWFALFDDDGQPATAFISTGSAAVTDQSDSWVQLQVSGPKARAALERICPVNLHPDAFPKGSIARTSMEHLGTIISNPDDLDTFELLAPRSSAKSFLHMIMTSVQNIS